MALPIHPHPKKDELLSSWLVRLAIENRFNVHTFYTQVLNCLFNIWNRDIDRLDITLLVDRLCQYTLIESGEIAKLSLAFYEGLIYEKCQPLGHSRWILPLGIYHRKWLRAGLQFCPMCLKLDPEPYFRKKWRLSFMTLCEKHGCYLESQCPKCHSPICFHRLAIGNRRTSFLPPSSLISCFHCGADLGETPLHYPPSRFSLFVSYHRNFLQTFIFPYWLIRNTELSMSLSFYNGLWILISAILGRRGRLTRQKVFEQTNINLNKMTNGKKMGFDYLSNRERFEVLSIAFWILEQWPEKFIELCSGTALSKSSFCDYREKIPFWLQTIVNSELDKSHYILSTQEVIVAARHISKKEPPVTIKKIARFLKIGKDLARKGYLAWKLSENAL